MYWIPYVVAYAGLAIFIIAVVMRFRMWAKMPMHMRWELYPVAHEPGERGKYGGSYLEETDWWKKPRETSLAGELRVMVPEIMFLVALKEHNKKLWTRSFPFHFGLYLVIACTVLMIFGGLLGTLFDLGGFGRFLLLLIQITGTAGMLLSLGGAIGLLQRRLTTPELKNFSPMADIFNLWFFIVVFGIALLCFLVEDGKFYRAAAFTASLVTFSPSSGEFIFGGGFAGFLSGLSVVLLAALVAYIPLTHMSHFIGKYFAYHAIRWNDKPNLKGGDQEAVIGELLSRPVSWSAPHIQGDGKKTWADVATANPYREEEKEKEDKQ